MKGALGRDLRAVRDREQLLARTRKPRQPVADRARDRTADAAVDFVEDDRLGAALLGTRHLQREEDGKGVGEGKRGSISFDPGCRSTNKKKKETKQSSKTQQ